MYSTLRGNRKTQMAKPGNSQSFQYINTYIETKRESAVKLRESSITESKLIVVCHQLRCKEIDMRFSHLISTHTHIHIHWTEFTYRNSENISNIQDLSLVGSRKSGLKDL